MMNKCCFNVKVSYMMNTHTPTHVHTHTYTQTRTRKHAHSHATLPIATRFCESEQVQEAAEMSAERAMLSRQRRPTSPSLLRQGGFSVSSSISSSSDRQVYVQPRIDALEQLHFTPFYLYPDLWWDTGNSDRRGEGSSGVGGSGSGISSGVDDGGSDRGCVGGSGSHSGSDSGDDSGRGDTKSKDGDGMDSSGSSGSGDGGGGGGGGSSEYDGRRESMSSVNSMGMGRPALPSNKPTTANTTNTYVS